MKRKLLALFIALAVIFTGIFAAGGINTYAATSGNCGAGLFSPGKNAKFNFDTVTKTLSIEGTGATKDYGESIGLYPPWHDYKDDIESVVIGEGIETLGNYSFFNCKSLKNITLPSSLKTIKGALAIANSGAFASCTALEEITLPEGLQKIGYNAFNGCTALKSITFPDSLQTLEGSYGIDTYGALGPFTGCTNLQRVVFGNGIKSTGVCSFANSGVKEVVFSSSLTEISQYSFSNTKILSVEIPENITTIGARSFANCTFLDTATIYNPNCVFGSNTADDPFNGSQQSLLIRGHNKSTAQAYAESNGYGFESIDPCDHLTTTTVIDPEPTCTTGGYSIEYCDNCGFEVSRTELPPNDHKFVLESSDDCVETDGHIYNRYVCDVCNEKKTVVEHKQWVEGAYTPEVIKEATCTEPGLVIYRCDAVGCSVLPKTEILPKGNHKVENYTVTLQPTCTQKGSKEGVCSVCEKLVSVDIPATGHSNALETTFDNTAEDGHIYEIYKCSVCSEETVKAQHIEWIDGFYNSTVITNPTCTVDGFRTDTCSCDGCTEIRFVAIPATGQHNWYETSRTEPDCTRTGTVFYSCSNEGCNRTKTESIKALGHDYVLQDSSVEPTCTEAGYNVYKCSRCGAVKQDVISALGHTPDELNYTVVNDATCTEDGLARSVCTVCGKEFDIVLEKYGHNFEDVLTEITDKPGHSLSTPVCTRCKLTQTGTVVHDEWLDGYFTTEKTKVGDNECTAVTIVTDTCSLCGKTRTETLSGKGHSYAYLNTMNNGTLVYRCAHCSNQVTRIPSLVAIAFKPNINRKTSEILIEGYVFDVTGDGIVNAKDYAVINKAVIISKAYS